MCGVHERDIAMEPTVIREEVQAFCRRAKHSQCCSVQWADQRRAYGHRQRSSNAGIGVQALPPQPTDPIRQLMANGGQHDKGSGIQHSNEVEAAKPNAHSVSIWCKNCHSPICMMKSMSLNMYHCRECGEAVVHTIRSPPLEL